MMMISIVGWMQFAIFFHCSRIAYEKGVKLEMHCRSKRIECQCHVSNGALMTASRRVHHARSSSNKMICNLISCHVLMCLWIYGSGKTLIDCFHLSLLFLLLSPMEKIVVCRNGHFMNYNNKICCLPTFSYARMVSSSTRLTALSH